MRRDSAEIWQMSWLGLSQAFMHAGRESSHRYSKIAPSVPSVRLCDKGYWWINFSIDYYLSHILWYRSTTDFLIVFCGFCGIFLIILYKFFHWFFSFFLEVLFFLTPWCINANASWWWPLVVFRIVTTLASLSVTYINEGQPWFDIDINFWSSLSNFVPYKYGGPTLLLLKVSLSFSATYVITLYLS